MLLEEKQKRLNKIRFTSKKGTSQVTESNSDEEQSSDSELSKEIKERVQEHVGNWGLISELTEEQYRKKRQAVVEEVITRKNWMKNMHNRSKSGPVSPIKPKLGNPTAKEV